MASTFSNVLSTEEIDSILNMSEVVNARNQLTNNKNMVDFTIHLSENVKQALLDHLGLNLQGVANIPMRWIRGDTAAHADHLTDGQTAFDNTHLVYLTDSVGTLDVDGQSYPIAKGAAYVFSEGLMHGSSNTGLEPRLLLGPMSNAGLPVGEFFVISAQTGDTIYIRQGEEFVEYSLDQGDWYEMFWPCGIINDSPETGPIFVSFTTDITLISNYHYFIVVTENILFGDISLKSDGSRPIITVADSNAYPGLVQNGTSSSYGHNRILIINLEIEARNSVLLGEAGWFAQAHYGGNTGGQYELDTNYIVNCSTSAPIGYNCGGIAGSNLAKVGGLIFIVGCYTTGTIGEGAGGIIGIHAGEDGGHVIVYRCFSTGLIGNSAGGIAGVYCGGHNGYIQIVNCYSTGEISGEGGGIVGKFCSTDAESQYGRTEIFQCYSNGAIGEDAGGIVGSTPGGWAVRTDEVGYTVEVINCFSSGQINNYGFAGGIYGRSFKSASQNAQNCYTSGLKTGLTRGVGGIYGGSASDVLTNSLNNYSEENNLGAGWNDSNAKSKLVGSPIDTMYGQNWCQPDGNHTPFKLSTSWFSPYISYIYLPQIFENGAITQTIVAGEKTSGPVVSGFTYKFLQINDIAPHNFPELRINSETGVISTAIFKDTRIYVIQIYSTRNPYSVTQLTLTVEGTAGRQCFANNLCAKGKKFVGGNRDASAVISARTTKTLTNLKVVDPKEKSDAVNVLNRQQALNRVRGGGYMVPKKVTGKYLQ
jgi:hypothetical protein